MSNRIMVIGLDGGTWSLLDRFMDYGFMPNLKRMCAEGYRAPLLSTVPAITPTAWTSFATGVNPGKHGVYGFLMPQLAPQDYIGPPARRDAIQVPSLWRHLSVAGKTCVVLSVPMTYPPEAINGAMVAGMFTPDPDAEYTYPPALKHELAAHDCLPRIQTTVMPTPAGGWEIPRVEDAMDVTTRLRSAALYLMQQPWDFMMMVFIGTDRLQHSLWNDIAAIGPEPATPLERRLVDFYTDLDRAVGDIIQAAGPGTTCLMMSDHGFGPSPGFFSLGRWLVDNGYAVMPGPSGTSVLRRVLRKVGVSRLLRRRLSGQTVSRLASRTSGLDWSRSRVCFAAGTHGVRINLRGRESRGIVEPGREFDDLRRELRERLLAVRLPQEGGKPVFSDAWFAEDLYHGPQLRWAPDVVVEANPELGYSVRARGEDRPDLIQVGYAHPGDHRRDGIFLAWGPGVVPNPSAPPAEIIDLAPTILWRLGQPVPADMDGRVLKEAFRPDVATAPVVAGGQVGPEPPSAPPHGGYSAEDQEKVEERLRNLGYL